ncbi:hypothetical protein C8J57DRAFT_1515306 [Mycena rebaudengoi]|nr:hypothetical protein C8J57DRAFT_1515306 [Mycena rebaudengoi]
MALSRVVSPLAATCTALQSSPDAQHLMCLLLRTPCHLRCRAPDAASLARMRASRLTPLGHLVLLLTVRPRCLRTVHDAIASFSPRATHTSASLTVFQARMKKPSVALIWSRPAHPATGRRRRHFPHEILNPPSSIFVSERRVLWDFRLGGHPRRFAISAHGYS